MPFSITFRKSRPVAPNLHDIVFMTSYEVKQLNQIMAIKSTSYVTASTCTKVDPRGAVLKFAITFNHIADLQKMLHIFYICMYKLKYQPPGLTSTSFPSLIFFPPTFAVDPRNTELS